MKRRTFIQRGSIGLGAILAGGGGAERLLGKPGERRRIYGIPDSVKPRSPLDHNLARYSLAQSDLPPEAWQDVVALSLLAQDVFDNPRVADAFSRNPGGYLRAIGMDDVALDPAASEVKVALALGDPQIRDAVAREDPKAFLEAIERKGLIRSPEPSQLASRLADQVSAIQSQLGPGVDPACFVAVVVCLVVAAAWIYVAAVQDVVVAASVIVAASLYAIAVIWTGVAGSGKHKRLTVWEGDGSASSVRLATVMGGEPFAGRVADAYVEEQVERVAEAVENLEAYRESSALSPARLREVVRAQMTRQLSGHAVIQGGLLQ